VRGLASIGCRVIGAAAVAGSLLAAFTPAPNVVARRLATRADVGPAQAIVVLGASVAADGTLSDSSLRRAIGGIRLYRAGLAPRLVLLGMGGEAASRARLAAELGVPREAMVIEDEEPTTRDEAARVAQVLGRRGERTVLLVTDVLHMGRARRLFEREGLVVRPAPTETGIVRAGTPEGRLRLTRTLLVEVVAIGYHRLFGYL
jgi:uncharacterized SAM-binding protein YcdF (DUF218 family)